MSNDNNDARPFDLDNDPDIANADLASAETERPIIGTSTKRVRLGDIRGEERTGKNGDLQRWIIVPFSLEETAETVTGKELPIGRRLEHRILASPTGGLTQAMINERLAKLQKAGTRSKTAQNGFKWSTLAGAEVMAKFTVNSKSGTDRQEVDFYPTPNPF